MNKEKSLKIGIFVCECGGNISDIVDVKEIVEKVQKWENVTAAQYHKYLCSNPTQERLVTIIKDKGLNRIVVACCTPRMHLSTFHSVLERAELNPYMLEFTNIREQCSWPHGPQKNLKATKKALRIIRGGYERSIELEPLETISERGSKDILVIGGGIAGITSSLQLGDLGFKVHLVEKKQSIGGNMAKLTKVFPTLDCAQCILTPRMAEVDRNANIKLYTYSQVQSISGRPGNYSAKIHLKRRGVDPERCKSCGVCEKVCPVSIPDEFNENLSMRKAVYLDFPQAVPSTYIIDFEACTRCGRCEEACPSKAIDLEEEGKTVELNIGVIILATGYDLYDAEKLVNLGYGVYKEVVTMMELERLTSASGPTSGYIKIGSRNVGKIAILLCAGSRDKNHVIYCSRICCMYALKQAYILKRMLGIDVYIYYTDIRATGKGYEELYWRNQEAGVFFVRGKIADVWHNEDGKLVVVAEDTLTGSVSEEEFDLLALATPMVPTPDLKELADKMNLSLGEDGFIQEKHPKLDPVDTLKTGVFACGCAISPKDVRDTVSDALGAAAKASLFLKSGDITTSPEKAFIINKLCDGCGTCLDICPSSAITMSERKVEIDPFLCMECGGCIPACPKEAIEYKNYTRRQLSAQLRGINFDKKSDEVRIITFVDKNIGYTDIDFLGQNRINYPEEIYVVKVPSTAVLGLKQILSTFAYGADGILIIEGQQHIDKGFTKERMRSISRSLKDFGIESYRIRYSHVPLPVYKKAEQLFKSFTDRIKKLGPLTNRVRDDIKECKTTNL